MNLNKRSMSQRSSSSTNKKTRTVDFNNYFHSTLKESGLKIAHSPDKCIASQETVNIIRNIKKNLDKHYEYPRNVSQFYSEFEKECEDLDVFKHYLFPNIIKISHSEDLPEEHPISESVIKILLGVPILQNKLTDYIFEKTTELAVQSKCASWIQMILKCFSSLESIVDREKITSQLIDLLDVSLEKIVRIEIINALPNIIGDKEHNNVATELSRILSEDQDLTPAILDCLSYLCLSDDKYAQLQSKTLNILANSTKYNYFPNFVKFLLIPNQMSDAACLDAVYGLRNALYWSPTIGKSQDIASSQVLTALAIRNSMVSSKTIANSWLKSISSCKLPTDHKPIDFIILLILYSTSEDKQKQVENLIIKQIKLDTLKEELLDDAFEKFKPILKEYLKKLIELVNSLLKNKTDPAVESFASHTYTLMLSKLEDCCQTVVAELLQLGLDSDQCVMNILLILNNVISNDMAILKPQSIQMLTLLDRTDNMQLDEVRAVMNLLCGLAYTYENSVIRDDMHMIIRKELSNSEPKIKVQGILAGVHAVKYLTAVNYEENSERPRDMPDNISYSSVTNLPEGNLREAAQIIALISRYTRQFPDMIAFCYDELSKIFSSTPSINKHFLAWLTEAVTNDLRENFIIDKIKTERIGDLKLTLQYGVNAETEISEFIAINIGELTLNNNCEVNVSILSPLFQLVQILHCKQNNNDLDDISALLGCDIVMPKFDIEMIEDMDTDSVTKILDCLIHCINWFRELLNAFATQNDNALRGKILTRILQVEDLEKIVNVIIIRTKLSYKPPLSTFDINKYTGEYMEKKSVKAQTAKKPQKKIQQDETILPETARSSKQATQIVKNKGDKIHNIHFRQLNLNLMRLFNLDMTSETESESELTIKTLNFLLTSVNENLENVLISRIKRKTFLTKQEPAVYDPKKATDYAKAVSEILPKVMNHLEIVTDSIDTINNVGSQNEEVIFTTDLLDAITCLENTYTLLTILFKWIGFRNHHSALLKSSLRSVAGSDTAIVSLKELLLAIAKKFQKHEKYCLLFSTALTLIELLKAIQNYSDDKVILTILKDITQHFMSKQWRTPEGAHEKGLHYNQGVDRLASIFFINNEILQLKSLIFQLTSDIKQLKNRNDTLSSLKCVNKSNFPILYRNLGTAVYEATKNTLSKGMTNSEHLSLWKDIATILKYMSDIAKTLDNRNNLSAFFKKSMPILKLFLSQGFPILDLQFKDDTQEVLEILKILQQSTRFLQSLCCHSRLKKDTVIMSKVPLMRQLLETLIYKVKASLAANKCSEAFWMGNLKNKNIHGEEIATQQSVESEESIEDGDDHLPEDEDSESDDILNPDSNSISDIV